MNRPAFPLVPLHQFQPGQTGQTFAILTDRIFGQTREGRPYYLCRFKDRARVAAVMIWAESPWYFECDQNWKVGSAYRLLVTYGIHDRFGPQLELLNLRPVTAADRQDGFDLAHLAEKSRFDAEALWHALFQLMEREISSEPVRRLIATIYNQHATTLRELPASDGRHFPFRGGWLEHVYSLTQSSLLLIDHYRKHFADADLTLDKDLVLAGALLHSIGRVKEFKLDPLGMLSESTVPGRLHGHVLLGRDLVRQAALEQGDIPQPFLERLEHLLLTQSLQTDGGATRHPMLPEGLILHQLQFLDAQLEMYLRCLQRDQNTGPFTARDPSLSRKLLKPGEWPDARVN